MGTLQTFASVYSLKDVDREIQSDYFREDTIKVLWKSIKFGAFTYLTEITDKITSKKSAVFFIFKVGFKKGEWYSVKSFDENAMPYYGDASLKALKLAETYGYSGLNQYGAQCRSYEYAKFKRGVVPTEIQKLSYKSAYSHIFKERQEIIGARYDDTGDIIYTLNAEGTRVLAREYELRDFKHKKE
jgi:hypothetical protein